MARRPSPRLRSTSRRCRPTPRDEALGIDVIAHQTGRGVFAQLGTTTHEVVISARTGRLGVSILELRLAVEYFPMEEVRRIARLVERVLDRKCPAVHAQPTLRLDR